MDTGSRKKKRIVNKRDTPKKPTEDKLCEIHPASGIRCQGLGTSCATHLNIAGLGAEPLNHLRRLNRFRRFSAEL